MDPVRVTCTYSFLKKNRHHFVMATVFSNLHCLLLVEKLARDWLQGDVRFQPTITRNEFTRYFCSAIWNGFIHWGEWNNFISSICIFLREELYNSRSQTKTTSTGVFWRNFDHQLTENFTLFKNLVPSSHLLRWSKYHTGWIKSLDFTSQDWFVQKSLVID